MNEAFFTNLRSSRASALVTHHIALTHADQTCQQKESKKKTSKNLGIHS